MTRQIDLSEAILDRHHEVFRCMGLLAQRVPEGWCVVGGLMVLIAGFEAGAVDARSSQTKDGDLVVDVVADPDALGRVFRELGALGYSPLSEGRDDPRFTRCTVATGASSVDLLAPDDAGPDLLEVGTEVRSLAIPGGRRALDLARPARITYSEEAFDVELRVPDLNGALVVKAAAAVAPATRDQVRHVQDVAFLLSAVGDPRETADVLQEDRGAFRQLAGELQGTNSRAWENLGPEERSRGLAALDFIVG